MNDLEAEILGPKITVDEHQWRDKFVRGYLEPLLAITVPLLLLAVIILAVMVQDVRVQAEHRDTAAAERGYANRAETCRIQVALGISLDADCLDSHVTTKPDGKPRYDPTASPTAGSNSPGQVRNLVMLCDIEREFRSPSSP